MPEGFLQNYAIAWIPAPERDIFYYLLLYAICEHMCLPGVLIFAVCPLMSKTQATKIVTWDQGLFLSAAEAAVIKYNHHHNVDDNAHSGQNADLPQQTLSCQPCHIHRFHATETVAQ